MLENAFIGCKTQPTESELALALGPAQEVWSALLERLADRLDLVEQEWKSPYPKYGWSLRLKRGKRNILYLSPGKDAFFVAFVLSDKALAAIRGGKFSKAVLKLLDEAPRYPEGTGVRFEVKSARDIPTIEKLTAVKLAN
jgi:hypothetical protein